MTNRELQAQLDRVEKKSRSEYGLHFMHGFYSTGIYVYAI